MSLYFYHIGGLMVFYRTILNQISSVLINPNNIEIEIHLYPEITILSLVDLQLTKILERTKHIERAKELKGIVLGGMKTSIQTLKKAVENEIYLSNSYGQTETCSQVFATDFTTDLNDLITSGKALGDTTISSDESGCLVIQSSSIAIGIYPDIYFDKIIHTSDLASLDEKNRLIVVGRADDLIISGGKKISPSIINDTLLSSNLNITHSITTKISSAKFGHSPATLVVSNEVIPNEKLLLALNSSNLQKFEYPSLIVQCTDLETIKNGIKIHPIKLQTIFEKINVFNDLLGKPIIRGNLNGQWLFIFHGFMGSMNDFLFLNEYLEKDYLIFYVNLPGHHESNLQAFSSFDDYCDEILKHIYEQEIDLNLLGYSLGGRIASVLCAKDTKGAIKNLILESSGLGIDEPEKRSRKESDAHLLNNITSQTDFFNFLEKWYEQKIFSGIKENAEFYHEAINKNFKLLEGFKHSLKIHGQAQMPNLLVSTLKKNCKNIFYIYGEADTKYEMVANNFKSQNCFVFKVPQASHICHIANKNRYIEIIKELLLK